MNLVFIETMLLSKQGLGAFRIRLRCLHVKQNYTDYSGSIFVSLADTEGRLLEQRVVEAIMFSAHFLSYSKSLLINSHLCK